MTNDTSIKSKRMWWWLIPIAFVLFLLSSRRIPIYDGGLPLSLALRVLHGEVPHRDFYYQYGPAQPFLFALAFRLVGVQMLAITVVEMLIKAGTVVLGYAIVRRVSSPWAAFFGATVVTLLMITAYPSAGMDVLLIVTASLLLSSDSFVALPGLGKAFSVGLLAGTAGLFRYEQGPMLLFLYVVLLIAGWLIRPVREAQKQLWLAVLSAASAYLLVTLPLFLYFDLHHALRDLAWQCFTFARLYYRAARHMPFPSDPWHHREQIMFYLPILIPPLAMVYLAWRAWLDRRWAATASATLIFELALLGAFYVVKGSIRVDFGQMLPANLVLAILLGVLLGKSNPQGVRFGTIALSVATLAGTVVFCKGLVRTWQKQGMLGAQMLHRPEPRGDVDGWCSSPLPLTTHGCFSMDPDHERAVLFLSQRTKPGDRLFVGLAHHDMVYAGDNLTYFATGTLPAVKWSHFDPDLQTRSDVQTRMIQDIQAYRPRYAVETREFEGNTEPNDSSKSSGVTVLDDYLRASYAPVATYGPVTVLERRTGQSK